MTSLITISVLALALSLVLTPVVCALARRLRILDAPAARKVHETETPRAGGVALYLAFVLAFLGGVALQTGVSHILDPDPRVVAFLLAGSLACALGLWDDVRGLRASWKFGGHVLVAVVAYAGGIQIVKVALPAAGEFTLGWLSLPVTVLWFVLLINALNLIDGLDGLAAGIAMFAAVVLLGVMHTSDRLVAATGLACLAGAALGFLRYNFHPASVFLGDSGSYFLGYNLAALSILGSVKSEATVAILIPIIALGVPVMDTLWAPIRRFILGQRLFLPDRDHIHHRLLKLGYTHRRAVLLLYGITILMGLAALSLVHTRDDRAAVILLLIGAAAILGIRKLGYLRYLGTDKFVGWLRTVGDELGLRRNRRSFLECQVSIAQAGTVEDMWDAVVSAARFLAIDYCELTVEPSFGSHRRIAFRHVREEAGGIAAAGEGRSLQLSMPLLDGRDHMGDLVVHQEMGTRPADPYLMRRIDQLSGTIAETLVRLRHRALLAAFGSPAGAPAHGGRMLQARILFLSHYFPPEGNAPATRVHAVCRHWVNSGHRVAVITCAPNVPNGIVYEGYENKLYQRELIDGVDTLRVWTYLAANKGTALRILNYVSYMASAVVAGLFLKKPDVVIATSPQFFCGWAGVITSRLRSVPLILEVRDIWPESIVTVGAMGNRRLVRLLEWLEVKMYAAAHHIVTVGEGYRDELCKKGVPLDKITVISNGVDREAFLPQARDHRMRDRWGLGDSFVCAYVGTVGMASGLDVLLRAGRLLQARGRTDITFLVVGDGAVRAELQRRAASGGLDNVVFTGRQDKETIPAILASVDACLVHLKKRDLFTTVLPSKIFEAAAMAKPIILGVQGHSAELLRRAGCGICVEPESATELVDAVIRLADDRPVAEELGRNGHDYFVEHFDRRALARTYLDLIQKVRSGAATDGNGAGEEPWRTADARSARARETPAAPAHRLPRPQDGVPPPGGIETSG